MADPNSSSSSDKSNGPTSNPGTVAPTPAPATPDPTAGAETRLNDLVTALLPLLTAVLSTAERKATPKVKKKGESLMGVFFKLALKRPELAPGRNPQELYDQYLVVEFLKFLVTQLRGITRKAEDTVLSGTADLWKAVLAIYGVAQHLPPGSGLDQELVDAVAQMKKALSTGPHKQKAVKAEVAPFPKSKSAMHKALKAQATSPEKPGEATPPATQPEPATAAANPQPAVTQGPTVPVTTNGTGGPSAGH